jgi:hypothetical protein
VFDRKLATAQSCEQVHINLRYQIVFLSLEPFVWFLLDDDHDIARFRGGGFITLASELYGLSPLHPLVDMYLQELLLGKDLLSFALHTPILGVNDFACAGALVARGLDLLDHRAHLPQGDLDTATAASVACTDGTLLATFAFAFRANPVPCESEFGSLALVEVFQSDVYAVNKIFGFARTLVSRGASAAKETAATTEPSATE